MCCVKTFLPLSTGILTIRNKSKSIQHSNLNPTKLTKLSKNVSLDDVVVGAPEEASFLYITVVFSVETVVVGVSSEVTDIVEVKLDMARGSSVTRLADSSFCAFPSTSWREKISLRTVLGKI